MEDGDRIAAVVEARNKLAAWSRDTGIAKHGDLTRMDRQIAAMCEASYNRKLAAWRRETGLNRGDRDR